MSKRDWHRPTFVEMTLREYTCVLRIMPVLRALLYWWMPLWRPS